jgi:hypothetical protein
MQYYGVARAAKPIPEVCVCLSHEDDGRSFLFQGLRKKSLRFLTVEQKASLFELHD